MVVWQVLWLVRGTLYLERAVAIEVFHEVLLPGVAHLLLKLLEIKSDGLLLLNQFPSDILSATDSLHHVVVIVDLEQPVDDLAVIRHIGILKLINVDHDLLNLLHTLRRTDPELSLGVLEAFLLDVLDLGD